MLALSGKSGGLESVIQLIKDKFFETLSESGSSTANKKEKAIPVKAGTGMQGKVTSDEIANYIHFMGIGQL